MVGMFQPIYCTKKSNKESMSISIQYLIALQIPTRNVSNHTELLINLIILERIKGFPNFN